jgi:hypothetical protein
LAGKHVQVPYLSGVESSRANIRAKGLPYSLRFFFNGLQVRHALAEAMQTMHTQHA